MKIYIDSLKEQSEKLDIKDLIIEYIDVKKSLKG
jgi:hypothetical protein